MKFNNREDQMYDWLKSIHNMLLGIMLTIGLTIGILVWHITNNLIFIPICFVGIFVFPLIENIRRRILHKKGLLK